MGDFSLPAAGEAGAYATSPQRKVERLEAYKATELEKAMRGMPPEAKERFLLYGKEPKTELEKLADEVSTNILQEVNNAQKKGNYEEADRLLNPLNFMERLKKEYINAAPTKEEKEKRTRGVLGIKTPEEETQNIYGINEKGEMNLLGNVPKGSEVQKIKSAEPTMEDVVVVDPVTGTQTKVGEIKKGSKVITKAAPKETTWFKEQEYKGARKEKEKREKDDDLIDYIEAQLAPYKNRFTTEQKDELRSNTTFQKDLAHYNKIMVRRRLPIAQWKKVKSGFPGRIGDYWILLPTKRVRRQAKGVQTTNYTKMTEAELHRRASAGDINAYNEAKRRGLVKK